MKRLWRKFKERLIKKLGGYVEAPPHTAWVSAERKVSMRQLINNRLFGALEREVREDLSTLLARRIVEERLYDIKWTSDLLEDAVVFRAYLGIVVPESVSTGMPLFSSDCIGISDGSSRHHA